MDFSAVKDFIDYGMNKALNDLKLRRLVDVKTREELANKKGERDWMKILIFLIVAVTIGLVGFTLITQFLNYNDVATGLAKCIVDQGIIQSQLVQCQASVVAPPVNPPLVG